jgi:hypothetical protein
MSSNTITQSYSFSPANVVSSGCRLWLDAADATTFTFSSGSNLSQWRDKSGSNNHATATVGPLYSASSNSVYFVGNANSYMNLPDGTLPSGNSPYFIIAVTTPLSGGFHLIGAGLPGANQVLSPGWNLPNDLFDAWFSNDLNAATAITFTNRQSMLEFNYNQTTRTIYVEGTSVGSGAASNRNSGTTSNVLAAYLSAGTPYTPMYLNEMIVYSNVITTVQRQQVEGYLAWKWNLVTNLPSNHPFKTTPPFANNPRLPPSLYPSAPIRLASSSSPFTFFSPASLSLLATWFDATDTSTLYSDSNGATLITSNESPVRYWRDKSTNANNVRVTDAPTPPTYQIGSFNAQPTLLFNNAYLNAVTLGKVSAQNASIFAFYKSNLGSGLQGPIIYAQGNGEVGMYPNYYFHRHPSNPDNGVSITDTYQPLVGEILYSDSSLQYYNNFNNISPSSPVLGTPGNVFYSSYFNVGTYANGVGYNPQLYIGEIIIYNRLVSITERQQIEGYLAWKWGLAGSLPAAHPFKNAPPGLPVPLVPQTRQLANRVFLPTSVSGCQIWLDAADSTTLTLSGNNVTQWNDKSGQGYILTVPSGKTSPTYSNGVLNTTGSAALWTTTNFAISGNSQVTLFLVYSTTGSNANSPGAHIGSAAGATPPTYFGILTYYQTPSTSLVFLPSCFEPDNINTVTPSVLGTRIMGCAFYNGTQINGSYNGTLLGGTSLTTANFGLQPFQIGARTANNSASIDGTICESVCYTSALTTPQRKSVEGYLAWKWGLVGSLPNNHPFKLWPPPPN